MWLQYLTKSKYMCLTLNLMFDYGMYKLIFTMYINMIKSQYSEYIIVYKIIL